MSDKCKAIKKDGKPCKNTAMEGTAGLCNSHSLQMGMLHPDDSRIFQREGPREQPVETKASRAAPAGSEGEPVREGEREFNPLRDFADPGRRSRVAHPEKREHQPEAEEVGAKMAQMLLAYESRERSRQSARRRDRDGLTLPDEERRLPFRVIPRRQRPDPTAIIDPITGVAPESLIEGYVHRWVRTVDWMDRPTESRVAEMEDYGYSFVTDTEGNPIESRFGVAMQAPPEQYAARMLDRTPSGSLLRDDALAAADEMAEYLNRQRGEVHARVVAEQDHGRYQTQEIPGQERFYDQ